jgi:hypothetical protein
LAEPGGEKPGSEPTSGEARGVADEVQEKSSLTLLCGDSTKKTGQLALPRKSLLVHF